jgi:hypothetical protein
VLTLSDVSSEINKPYRCEECGVSFKSQQMILKLLRKSELYASTRKKSFNAFHFGFAAAAVSMILKTDQATSDSFSAYCQIAVHMICSFSRNFYCTRYKDDLLSQCS